MKSTLHLLFTLLLAAAPSVSAVDYGPVVWGHQKLDIRELNPPFTQIATGWSHTVALKSDGTVVAWGRNNEGQATVPAGLSGVSAVAAGGYHTVALKSDGTVVAWGRNNEGQATVPAGLSGVSAVAAGGYHTVALKSDGTVVAWGYNAFGQATVPEGLSGVSAVAAGWYHTVALKSDGTVVAWGRNDYGEATVPEGLSGVSAVAAGARHSLALKSDGTVVAWGRNDFGQTTVPAGLSGVSAVAAGGFHSLALKSDGTVVAWGRNNYDQATVPAGLSGVSAVAAGEYHTVALKSDGTVVAWGHNYFGQATVPAGLSGVSAVAAGGGHTVALESDGTVVVWGRNFEGQATVPAGLSGVSAVAAGYYHTVALKSDGTVVAWGSNTSGQTTVPAGLSGVSAVAAGGYHTVALKSDGTVVAWGDNYYGQTTVPAGLSGVSAVAAGGYHTVALKSDGTVVAWGRNNYGQAMVPAGLSGVSAVAAGSYHTVALKSDGTVVAWGDNYFGQARVPAGLSGVSAVAAGYYHNVALKSDGTVVAWGDNYYGQTTVPAGLSGVSAVAAGGYHTVALVPLPEIVLSGNGMGIANGDDTPDTADHTDFGGAPVGGSPVARTFTITNTGTADLALTGAPGMVEISGSAAFGITRQPASATVAAGGGTQTFEVSFAPATPGPHTATVSIANDDPDSNPFTFTVAGTGLEAGSLSLSSAVYASSGGAVLHVTVERTGGTAATSVTLGTSDGSAGAVPPFAAAVAGVDYEALSVVVDFAEGEMSKTVPIPLIPRTGRLPNRRFLVTLSQPTNGAELGLISIAEVRLLAPDTKSPVLAVTFPPASAKTVAMPSPFFITGTAGDALGVDRVELEYEGETFTITPGFGGAAKLMAVPWAMEFTPNSEGPVSLTFTAYDLSGNSTTVTRSFVYERRHELTLTRSAPMDAPPDKAGTVQMKALPSKDAALIAKPNFHGIPAAQLPASWSVKADASLTLTAAAKTGHLFSHWTGLPEGAEVRGNMAAFLMPMEEVSVTAVFVENPLTQGAMAALGSKPVFQGLLRPDETTPPGNDTAGFLSAALTPAKGSLSGKLWMDGLVTAFTGALHGDGSVWFKAGKVMAPALPFAGRELTMTWSESGLAMSVSRAVNEVNHVSTGQAKPPLYSKTTPVRGALLDAKGRQGYFTLALPAVEQDPVKPAAEYPQGSGHAGLTLLANGTLKLAGTLAEGTKVTAASFLVEGDAAEVFVVLPTPGGKTKAGSLLGTLVFDEAQADVTSDDMQWFRPEAQTKAGVAQAYRSGWPDGIAVGVLGALYDKTATAQATLGFSTGVLGFTQGGLPAPVEVTNFTLSGSKVTKVPSTDKSFSLSFTQSTGLMRGTFTPGWPSAKLPAFQGVLLGKGANRGGWGYFLSNQTGDTDPESGAVTLGQP